MCVLKSRTFGCSRNSNNRINFRGKCKCKTISNRQEQHKFDHNSHFGKIFLLHHFIFCVFFFLLIFPLFVKITLNCFILFSILTMYFILNSFGIYWSLEHKMLSNAVLAFCCCIYTRSLPVPTLKFIRFDFIPIFFGMCFIVLCLICHMYRSCTKH